MVNFSDRLFKKIFMGLVTLALMLTFILSAHLLLDIPLHSAPLWVGSLLVYLAVNLVMNVRGIVKKLVILGVSILIMSIFFFTFLHVPILPGLLLGALILMISGMLYVTFLH